MSLIPPPRWVLDCLHSDDPKEKMKAVKWFTRQQKEHYRFLIAISIPMSIIVGALAVRMIYMS